MKAIHAQPILLSRRSFLKNSGKAALTTAVITSPAANAFLPALARAEGDVVVSLLLDTARVMAGFIFNTVHVVKVKKVIKFVAKEAVKAGIEEIVEAGIEEIVGTGIKDAVEYTAVYYRGLPDDKGKLDRDLYREEVIQIHPVRLGMSDEEYNAYRAQKQKIILTREEDLQRFEEITRYLVDNKARILLPTHNTFDLVNSSTLSPEHLISGLLRFSDPSLENNYRALLEKTEVDVFNQLVA